MPPKRPHKKSRYGCDHCRKRRVKCDEKMPSCTTCVQRGDPCCYSRSPAGLREKSFSSRDPSSPITDPHSDVTCTILQDQVLGADLPPSLNDRALTVPHINPILSRFQEVEIMHHWCTNTCNSFTEELGTVFRDYVVKQALRLECLMESLFALTSLHMACEAKDEAVARRHMSIGLHYHTQAVAGFRNTLSTLSPSNCDAIFLSSVLIMVCSIVSPLLPAGYSEHTQSPAEAMLTLADLVRGIASIHSISRDWLLQGPLGGILERGSRFPPIALCFPLQELRSLNMNTSCNRTRKLFDHAIEALEQAIHRVKSVIPWLTAVKPEFLEELKNEASLALAMFMYWGVLLDQLDKMWWAKYSGRRLVEELSDTLDTRGEEWRFLSGWCRAQVGLCKRST